MKSDAQNRGNPSKFRRLGAAAGAAIALAPIGARAQNAQRRWHFPAWRRRRKDL